MTFEILCDNKNSYSIHVRTRHVDKLSPAIILVRCNRLDARDNLRGSELADVLVSLLKTLPLEDIERLVTTRRELDSCGRAIKGGL